jgi:hypothetical protein
MAISEEPIRLACMLVMAKHIGGLVSWAISTSVAIIILVLPAGGLKRTAGGVWGTMERSLILVTSPGILSSAMLCQGIGAPERLAFHDYVSSLKWQDTRICTNKPASLKAASIKDYSDNAIFVHTDEN